MGLGLHMLLYPHVTAQPGIACASNDSTQVLKSAEGTVDNCRGAFKVWPEQWTHTLKPQAMQHNGWCSHSPALVQHAMWCVRVLFPACTNARMHPTEDETTDHWATHLTAQGSGCAAVAFDTCKTQGKAAAHMCVHACKRGTGRVGHWDCLSNHTANRAVNALHTTHSQQSCFLWG